MPQRILLVEDSPAVTSSLRRPLEAAGFRLDLAEPAEAMARLEVGVHALAIVPPRMGASLVEALKRADRTLPVVLFFPDDRGVEAETEALVADGVLVGPVSAPSLVSCCRAMARLRAQSRRISSLQEQVERARAAGAAPAMKDYEFFKRLLLMEVKRSRRYHYPISLALVAVDRWKELGPRLGARERAALLGDLLGIVNAAVRDIDLALLYSEDRFLVFMPHTRADGALNVSNRLCSRVRSHRGAVKLTVSVGVATFEGTGTMSFSTLTRMAAEALARAQAGGGDQAAGFGGPRKKDRVVLA